jgi:hypothetical protein
MEQTGSPDCNIDRTFICQFYFQPAIKKPSSPKKKYKNPIYLAKEYKEMLDSSEVKNQAELAKLKGISRARVTQILNLLKLKKSVINALEHFRDSMDKKVISERKLRNMINKYYSPEKNCNM